MNWLRFRRFDRLALPFAALSQNLPVSNRRAWKKPRCAILALIVAARGRAIFLRFAWKIEGSTACRDRGRDFPDFLRVPECYPRKNDFAATPREGGLATHQAPAFGLRPSFESFAATWKLTASAYSCSASLGVERDAQSVGIASATAASFFFKRHTRLDGRSSRLRQ